MIPAQGSYSPGLESLSPGQTKRYHLGCKITALSPHNYLASIVERGNPIDLFLDAEAAEVQTLFEEKLNGWIEGYLSKLGLPETLDWKKLKIDLCRFW